MKDKKYFIDLISKHCSGMYNSDLLITSNGLEELAETLSNQVEKPVILPSDFNWLEASTKFYIERRFVCKALRDIEIVMKRQLNGNAKWAVKCDESFALSKVDGHFDYEPMPSERDDTYLLEHRFDSKEEALQEYRRLVNAETLCIVARSK